MKTAIVVKRNNASRLLTTSGKLAASILCIPHRLLLYVAFPSNRFVFLILLGSGEQENEAVFPSFSRGWRGGRPIWDAAFGQKLAVVGGQGQLPAG